ncbi:hypothetical protein EST38_g4715 [Candolleomyces aberdarensis]|uniref:Uncharacterized protein n=1 Tax=Candolleomyces aberdarensis TaxID=2316362 RepID=A0A4Q2DMB4_9AGAR|nr:hypothetical protein EST38_g4715 [Candolleomyces aberdarensis]
MERLSLSDIQSFHPTFNRLVKYIIASHAIKVADRIKDNSISKELFRAFCELPKPSQCVPGPPKSHRGHEPRPSAGTPVDAWSSSTSSTTPSSSASSSSSSSTPKSTSASTSTSSTETALPTRVPRVPSPPPPPPPQGNSTRTRTQSQQQYQQAQERLQQLERDKIFLDRFLHKQVVETLKNKVKITNLQNVAYELRRNRGQAAGASGSSPSSSKSPATETPETFQIYFCGDDGGTADEFHELLVFLLSHEEGYLGTLVSFVRLLEHYHQAMQESPSSSSSPSSTTSSPLSPLGSAPSEAPPDPSASAPSSISPTPTPTTTHNTRWTLKKSKQFSRACTKLTDLGILLRDAIASSAFKQHLRRMRRWLHRPVYQLEELGRGKENMDFHIQSRLVCPQHEDDDGDGEHHHAHGSETSTSFGEDDEDDDAAGEDGCITEEVYATWMKMQVDHLESLFVLRKYLHSRLPVKHPEKPSEGKFETRMLRPVVRTVVSLPGTIQPSLSSSPVEIPPPQRNESSPKISIFEVEGVEEEEERYIRQPGAAPTSTSASSKIGGLDFRRSPIRKGYGVRATLAVDPASMERRH